MSSIAVPHLFHDLVTAWRDGAGESPKYANGTFRGITNSMPGYWAIVGVTRKAYALMEERGWLGDFTKGLRRDHIKSGRDFQQHMLENACDYDEFCRLVADYGRCIVCTKDENPPHVSGYGNAYSDADVLWLAEGVDTSASMTVPGTKRMAALLKAAAASSLQAKL